MNQRIEQKIISSEMCCLKTWQDRKIATIYLNTTIMFQLSASHVQNQNMLYECKGTLSLTKIDSIFHAFKTSTESFYNHRNDENDDQVGNQDNGEALDVFGGISYTNIFLL